MSEPRIYIVFKSVIAPTLAVLTRLVWWMLGLAGGCDAGWHRGSGPKMNSASTHWTNPRA